jgi:hypothetical protein
MSTLTIDRSNQSNGSETYLAKVGEASRTLLAALLAVKPAPARKNVSASAKHAIARKEVSLVRLYCMAVQSDSVAPAVTDQLRQIAASAEQ